MKTSIILVFRVVISCLLLFWVIMVFWSSNANETRLVQIENKVDRLQKSVEAIQCQPQITQLEYKSNPHIDLRYPNLLTKDPFLAQVLPGLLKEEDFQTSSLLLQGTIGKPDSLHPFSLWHEVSTWRSLCVPSLGRNHFGIYDTFSPYLAYRMEERPTDKGPELWVFLRDNIFWRPLNPTLFPQGVQLSAHFLRPHPVTAHDFLFYFEAAMNPYNQEPRAQADKIILSEVEEFRVIDDKTFVVRWRAKELENQEGVKEKKAFYYSKDTTKHFIPLPCFVYQYYPDGTKIIEDEEEGVYQTNSTFGQTFMEHWAKNYIVSCGMYEFAGMSDEGIAFKKNPYFKQPLQALFEKQEFLFRNSVDSIWNDVKEGKIRYYVLPPIQLPEWERFRESPEYHRQKESGDALEQLHYTNNSFVYLGWNQTNPLFKDKQVRQAMTLAIDRKRLVDQILNGQGIEITGPIHIHSKNYDPSIIPWPFDPQRAKEMLKAQGWEDSDGDGVLDKEIDGRQVPFRFAITYYVKNTTTKTVVEFIVSQLKNIGIDAIPNGVDVADLGAKTDDKDFEAIILGWVLTGPPENPKQLWLSDMADEKGSSNFIGFRNKRVDEIIALLEFVDHEEQRKTLYHEFLNILHEEQPYTFLYTPLSTLLYRKSMQNVFLPINRQDLIPGATVGEPEISIVWDKGVP